MNCFFICIINNIIYKMKIYHYDDLKKLEKENYDEVNTISISGYITNIYNTPIPQCNNLITLNIQCAKIPVFTLNNTFHSLKQLSLCRCDLTKIFIDLADLSNLSKLKTLNLSANNLTNLPKEIYNLTNLRSLWLDSNKLTKISKNIKNLTKLTSLRIQNNKLEKFPSKIYKLCNLEELFHSYKIDKRISQLYNLKRIETGKKDFEGNIYVYKDYMLVYNYFKSPKFKIEIGDNSDDDLSVKIDEYTRLYGRNKIMIEIPPNIKFLNIIKTKLEYLDLNKLPNELEHLQIKSNSPQILEFNNYPYTLKKLSLVCINKNIDDSDYSSSSLKIDKIKNKIKVPFGCELFVE